MPETTKNTIPNRIIFLFVLDGNSGTVAGSTTAKTGFSSCIFEVVALPDCIPDRQDSYRFAGVPVRHVRFGMQYCGWCRNSVHICFGHRNIPAGALCKALPNKRSLLLLS